MRGEETVGCLQGCTLCRHERGRCAEVRQGGAVGVARGGVVEAGLEHVERQALHQHVEAAALKRAALP